MATGSGLVSSTEALSALAHPVRLQILDALRTPASAAEVARQIGQSRQNVNYHVKELERAGLVRAAGERRRGNLIEPQYESVAGTFVIAGRATWPGTARAHALRDQVALEHLVGAGERLQQDAASLLDRATFDGEEIPSAAVSAEVSFPDADARATFMKDYLEMLGPLLKKHGARRGTPFRVLCAVYPNAGGDA